MHLLPGDRLWDRYRVERVAGARCDGAWLIPAGEGTPAGAERFLLVPLHARAAHPMAALLSAAARVVRLKPPTPPQPTRARKGRLQLNQRNGGPANRARISNFEFIPLLGSVEWIGEADEGGVAIVAAPPALSLESLLEKTGPLSAPQALPILLDLARSLDALCTVFGGAQGRPAAGEAVLRAACRLLNPARLALRSGDGRPVFQIGLGDEPALNPTAWHDFLAPELYSEAGAAPAAFVFSAARIGAYLLGGERPAVRPARAAAKSGAHARVPPIFSLEPITEESAWAAMATWASGKRDPAREYQRGGLSVPAELDDVLVRCLARRPGRRMANPGKLMAALKKLLDCPWARLSRPCAGCGLEFSLSGPACPACGRDLPAASHGAGAGATGTETGTGTGSRGGGAEGDVPPRGGRRATTTLLKRSGSGASSSSSSAIAAAVAAVPGMTLISGGSFLSGERKVPRTLRTFLIDTTPVTEGDFKRYLAETGERPREHGPGSRAADFDGHPVTRATWYEASAYAEHFGKRLPTVYEWEKASRGNDGRKFPYGNTYKPNCGRLRVNAGDGPERQAAAVGSYPAGKSPAGVLDMAGNVLEWTSTARRAGERIFRAVKGACYLDGSPELSRCTSVQYIRPESAELHLGFRCVKDVE